MARISTYSQDSTMNKLDKIVGSDSATNATRNYTIESIINLINDISGINLFDGVKFRFQDYDQDATDPVGIINITGTSTLQTSFSSISQIIISKKTLQADAVQNYLASLEDQTIKLVQVDNLNNFGIYKVTDIQNYTNDQYFQFTLTHLESNGSLNPQTVYFLGLFNVDNSIDFASTSVAALADVTSAGSGQIITVEERGTVDDAVTHSEVVNNLTSTSTNTPLSAKQGKVLKDLIDTINTLLTSDNDALDSLQEIVDYVEANRETLNTLGISNISGLQTALNGKQNTEAGKGLSTNDFTDLLLQKLSGIAAGAQVNVQTDWNGTGDAAILNKPTNFIFTSSSVTALNDVLDEGSGYIITDAERQKLNNIDAGAEVNVQANWNATSGDAQILNKPDLTTKVDTTTSITVQGTTNEIEVTPNTAQDLSANRTVTVGLPDDVTVTNDLTVGNDLTVADALSVGESLEVTETLSATPTFDNGMYFKTEDGHDTLHFRYHGHDLSIDQITEVLPTGILRGGDLSKANNTQFTIAAGGGIINILNKGISDPHPEIKRVNWSQQTITVFNLDSQDTEQKNAWIYIDSTGTVNQQAAPLTSAQKNNNILIGSAIHTAGVLQFTRTFPRTAYNNTSQVNEFLDVIGPLKKSGHKVTANGTNLSLDRSAGVAFALGRNYSNDANNPSTVSDSAKAICKIHRYYDDGASGHEKDTNQGVGYNVIDPGNYDDGDGTLASMQTSKFSVQRIYYFPNSPDILIVYYGRSSYSSIDEAEKNYLLEDFTEADNTAEQAIYLGALIVKGSATDLSDSTQAKILTGGIFRSLSATNVGGVAANAALGDLNDVNVSSPSNNQVLKYNSTTSLWENQADAGGIALTDLSVGTEGSASGDGAISYNDTTGVFTYTPPDLSSYLTAAVDGTGTAGTLPKMSDSDTITDSSISESGQVVTVDTTGAIQVPDGTTAERPSSPVAGMFRYNTEDAQFEGYTTEWGAIAGSGGGSSIFNKDLFNGDDSTTSFTMAQAISDENNTQVYIDGVYQSKENYTVNGTAINFSTAPPTGTNNIEVISVTSLALEDTNTLTRDGFTGDGSTTAFTLSVSPTSEDLTFVYIQGVYQEKSTYSLSGDTITFTTAPQNGYTFEVMSLTAANITQTSYMASDSFSTPTQGQTSFTLVNGTPSNKSFTMVFISGVYQDKSTYSLTSGAIVLSQGVDAEDTVEVISIGNGGVLSKPVSDANDARYSVNVISANDTAVAGAVYVFTASLTLTLPASPEVGESIKISNLSDTATCVLGRNGNKIMGDASDLTLDTASASFELIYSGTAKGWVIIGQ